MPPLSTFCASLDRDLTLELKTATKNNSIVCVENMVLCQHIEMIWVILYYFETADTWAVSGEWKSGGARI